MKLKILYFLFLLLSTSLANAAVIGWEVYNHTNHPVTVELFKHCMTNSPHDGVKELKAGGSYQYEELQTVNSGNCFFEISYVIVRIYGGYFRRSFDTDFWTHCFKEAKLEDPKSDSRVEMSSVKDGCKLKLRFDINK